MYLHAHPCLFCGDRKLKRTSEHILQKGFGSNWTLPDDVCTDCNSKRFSALDESLIDFADRLVYSAHPDVLSRRMLLQAGHTVSYDEKLGIWQSVYVDKDSRPVILPQFIVASSDRIHIALNPRMSSDWKFQVEQIRQELSNSENISFKELIFDQPDPSYPPVQPAVIRSQKNKYLLRGATQEEITKLKEQIIKGQLLSNMNAYSEPEYINQRNSIASHINISLKSIDRALAKSAVNAVCACLGPDRARQPALQRIKSFVLGEIPYQEDEFVEHWWKSESRIDPITQLFGKPDCHTVVLASTGIFRASFLLYGKMFASVKLTEEVNFLQPDESVVVLLNYKAKTHEMYRLPEDIERFAERFMTI